MALPQQKDWHLFIPKSVTVLHQGYSKGAFRADLIAGTTVAIVALPLAMALAIASGATPSKGLITAIVAGFIISALSGSRFQIGGPTGAFVVIVASVIQQFGFDGLLIATFMAGIFLIIAGIARLGTWIKYIPEPVIAGFTSGIAVIIASSQIKDFVGLHIEAVPADIIKKFAYLWQYRQQASLWATIIAISTLLSILFMRKYLPRWPGFLIAVSVATLATYLFHIPVETIGSRFGGIPVELPSIGLPAISWARIVMLLPSAFTIAFLAGIESLLCAIVADGMTGRRHRSNCELVAQGVANIASAFVGGLPATGAIARTATNIRSGATSPIAGMIHAITLLIVMLALAPLAYYIPLAALASVLMIVAWNMSEFEKFRTIFTVPLGDSFVFLTTFALTIFVDLTAAIQVGVLLGAILFMHRMAELFAIRHHQDHLIESDRDDFAAPSPLYERRSDIPDDVEVFYIQGPLFFGASNRMTEMLDHLTRNPKFLIVRMREVPLIDSSGIALFRNLIARSKRQGTKLIFTELQPEPLKTLKRAHLLDNPNSFDLVSNFQDAIKYIKTLSTNHTSSQT